MRQKRMALINDITGFGRCSIAIMAPILSVMKSSQVRILQTRMNLTEQEMVELKTM